MSLRQPWLATWGLAIVLASASGCPSVWNRPIHLPMRFGEEQRVIGRVYLANSSAESVYLFRRDPCTNGPGEAEALTAGGGRLSAFARNRIALRDAGSEQFDTSFEPLDFLGPPPGEPGSAKGMVLLACAADEEPRELELAFGEPVDDELFTAGWRSRARRPLAAPTVVVELPALCAQPRADLAPVPVVLIHSCAELSEVAQRELPECAR